MQNRELSHMIAVLPKIVRGHDQDAGEKGRRLKPVKLRGAQTALDLPRLMVYRVR